MVKLPGTPKCRFCGRGDDHLEIAQLEVAFHRGVMQPLTSKRTYYQHAACLAAERAFIEESERRASADRKAVEDRLREAVGR